MAQQCKGTAPASDRCPSICVTSLVVICFAAFGTSSAQDLQVGAPITSDFTTWQSGDDETSAGGGRWYCNATMAADGSGVLTDWELFIDNGGVAGETAQLSVIRCTAGSGGSGPALSGCSRVGIGPLQSITGNGVNGFTLAGSTQLDGADTDPDGIVVQAGDYICADSNAFDIGVDCTGDSTLGGCPGPDLNTQLLVDLDVALEPFGLSDSASDGTLMIKSWGNTTPQVVTLYVSRTMLAWSDHSSAIGYDVVRGSIGDLTGNAGNFSLATRESLACMHADTSLPYANDPAIGDGSWFLVRIVTAFGDGTYDSGGPAQVGSRDEGIATSGFDCY